MRFHHDVVGERNPFSDGRVIRERNGGRVEEAAAVVELDLSGPRSECARAYSICRGIAPGGTVSREGVLPQIAHQTTPGALLVREQDGGRIHNASETGPLLFQEKAMGLEGIEPPRGAAVAAPRSKLS